MESSSLESYGRLTTFVPTLTLASPLAAGMTLRWKSIIPAGIAHTVSNILVVAGINYQTPWSGELHILEWAVVAFLLFRYWPLAETEPAEAISPPVRLESAT